MKDYIKSEIKHIPMMIILIVLFYGIKVMADSYALTSTEISFDNSGTNITATNMQNAINETFLHATDYNEIKTTIGNSTLTTTSQTLTGAVNEINDQIVLNTYTVKTSSSYANGTIYERKVGRIVIIYGNFQITTAIPSAGELCSNLPIPVVFTPAFVEVGSTARRVLVDGYKLKADSEGIPTGWINFTIATIAAS